jgi:prepilin-type N-terminal cleavage/methylation domain-containing protein
MRSNKFFRGSSRRGLTLIEVIAATVLLGTMLVAAVSGFSANRRQLLRAAAKEQSLAAMDQLIVAWFAEQDWRKMPSAGRCVDAPSLVWRATRLRTESLGDPWPVYTIRFEIFFESDDREPLTSLEVLAADEPEQKETSEPNDSNKGRPQ